MGKGFRLHFAKDMGAGLLRCSVGPQPVAMISSQRMVPIYQILSGANDGTPFLQASSLWPSSSSSNGTTSLSV
eukprot:12923303-Prorocentrum_lima.AAC.1